MSDDKDKRIKELEDKVAALTKENADLKAASSNGAAAHDGGAKPAEKKTAAKKAPAKKAATLGAEKKKKPVGKKDELNPVAMGKKALVMGGKTAARAKGAPASVAKGPKLGGVHVTDGKDQKTDDPLFQSAVKAREAFNRTHIHELAIMATPPQPVVEVGIALGAALGIPCADWKEAKAIIKEPKLISTLEKFDYTKNDCKGLDKAVAGFDIPTITKGSKAAGALAEWLVALKNFKFQAGK